MGNWSLVCFTLSTQSAIGLVWVSVLARWLGKNAAADFSTVPMLSALALSGLGLSMALTHLARPGLAPHAIRNLAFSWLSREVLLVQAFAGAVALSILLPFLNIAGGRILLELAACLLGGAALYAMVSVYLLRTVPVWNSPATYLEFAGSAILLGGALRAVITAFGTTTQSGWSPVTTFAGIAIFLGLILKLAAIPPSLAADKAARDQTWYPSTAGFFTTGRLLAVRQGLYLAGLLPALAAISWPGPAWLLSCLALASFGTGEVLGRQRFYKSYRRVGL